jgi:hypothetical protein
MPYGVRKRNGSFQVYNRKTGRMKSRHTTKAKAERQRRLLEGVYHGNLRKS